MIYTNQYRYSQTSAIRKALAFLPAHFNVQSALLRIFMLSFVLILSACNSQQQNQQPDPRLKNFQVQSSRIILLDNQAEVDGTILNTGHDRFPFDVTLIATLYDSSGNVIGTAQGIAEDVWPGMTRPFALLGQVDPAKYSRFGLTPTSLRERRYEKNIPSPPPVVP